jgi:alkylation response protein AidB-like acyl-CoA dehydrogenase
MDASVSLNPTQSTEQARITEHARDCSIDTVDDALVLAIRWGRTLPKPGEGSTADLWEHLASVAAHDLGAARAIEPHLDAVAILDQAGLAEWPIGADPAENAWGVFAAEGGPPLTASEDGDAWVLNGTKPWCSLADRLGAALVTATLDGGERRLFAVALQQDGITTHNEAWVARGLTEIPSGPVDFDGVEAFPVGDAGWYLSRPGFAWGGIGVAACWYGGAVGVARTLFEAAHKRSDPLVNAQVGAVDELLQSARRGLAEAASLVDAGQATGTLGTLTAKRVRATVARVSEEVLGRVGHALGPAPLAKDAAHAKRVADLQLYLRQHHAERDDASLGEALLAIGGAPW